MKEDTINEMRIKLSFLILFLFLINAPAESQTEYARELLDSLCSENYDGRGYVNKGDVRSADFIVRELKLLGLSPIQRKTFEQKYTFDVNTFPGKMEVVIGEDSLKAGIDYLIDPNTGGTTGSFNTVLISAANQQELIDAKLIDQIKKSKNQIFIFDYAEEQDPKMIAFMKSFAYQITEFAPVVWLTSTKQLYAVGRKTSNNSLILLDKSKYQANKKIHLSIESKFINDYESKNVFAKIKGKKKRKYIVFTAHLDHLGRMGNNTYFPGANDNASGVSMLLSLAKFYTKHKPEYTTIFCFFSGEEAGLEGSKYFIQHPLFKLDRIKFVLNVDIMGSANEGITVVNATEHKASFELLKKINLENNYIPQIKERGPSQNSDHYYFTQEGIPAFFIYSIGDNKHYHDINDSAQNANLVNFGEVQQLLLKFCQEIE